MDKMRKTKQNQKGEIERSALDWARRNPLLEFLSKKRIIIKYDSIETMTCINLFD
jgi:hypothetical protein